MLYDHPKAIKCKEIISQLFQDFKIEENDGGNMVRKD